MSTHVTLAVIPAAGKGTRMRPLTDHLPKPLIPVAGVPILERILRGMRGAGIERAVIITGYLGHMIEDYFGDGARVDMRLQYHLQDPQNGTGGALMQVEQYCGREPFMLHWGDILIDPSNYAAILNTFTQAPAMPACALGMNWMDDPASGAAVYREHGRIVKIVEKPAPGTSTTHWNNAGVMVLGPRVWPYLGRLTPSPRGELEFTDVLHMMINGGETLLGHELRHFWSDVGTPHIVEALNADARLTAW